MSGQPGPWLVPPDSIGIVEGQLNSTGPALSKWLQCVTDLVLQLLAHEGVARVGEVLVDGALIAIVRDHQTVVDARSSQVL